MDASAIDASQKKALCWFGQTVVGGRNLYRLCQGSIVYLELNIERRHVVAMTACTNQHHPLT